MTNKTLSQKPCLMPFLLTLLLGLPMSDKDSLINEIVRQLEYFDVEKYLDSRNIEYLSEGKNIKHGWIGMQCLWCDDPSNHLGINLDSKSMNCWRCSAKGTVIKVIMKIERCSLRNVLSLVKEFSNIRHYVDTKDSKDEYLTQRKTTINLPLMSRKELFPAHKQYLEKRGFDPELIFKKYDLSCVGPIGKWKHRLIIPFYSKRRLVTFSSRDITGRAKIPYVHQPENKSILSTKETIYNIDNCKDTIIVVEGVIDAWKIGDNCGATMGIKWTSIQLSILSQFKRVFILFDAEQEAQENAERLCYDLSSSVDYVENLELDEGDPGAMGEEDVKHLRKEVFGKIY